MFSRTTKTSVRDFCDISYLLAGPDRSHQATTERRIGRKPRKFRDKFESIQSPAKTFYNNGLSVAVLAVSSEPVSAEFPAETVNGGAKRDARQADRLDPDVIPDP